MMICTICSENTGYRTQFISTVRELVGAAENLHQAQTSRELAFARLERAHDAWCKSWRDWSIHQESCSTCSQTYGLV